MTNKVALLIAVVLAGISIFLVMQYVQEQRREAYRGTKLVEAAVLNRDVVSGESFDPSMVEPFRMPDQVMERMDAVLYDEVDRWRQNAFAKNVDEGQVLFSDHFSITHTGEGRIDLADGQRAISTQIAYDAGLSGLLQVNDFVDVIGVFEIESAELARQYGGGSGRKFQTAVVIARQAKVLALDANTGTGAATGYQAVTLDVKPVEAELIAMVREFGKIHLTLRNDTEQMEQNRDDLLDQIADVGGVLPDDLVRILEAERSSNPRPLSSDGR